MRWASVDIEIVAYSDYAHNIFDGCLTGVSGRKRRRYLKKLEVEVKNTIYLV